MIILDTTFLIDLMKGKRDLASYLNDTMEKGTVIATTVFNVYELYKNVFMREFDKIEAFLSNIKIISFSNAVIATKLCKELKSKGQMIPEIDLLIASICLDNSASLITKNIKDFKDISGLKIINQNLIKSG